MENKLNLAAERLNEISEKIKSSSTETKRRPTFHFASPAGWCNDPNGFSFYKNKVHLFFQWHPFSNEWGPMHWGHATTKDFVRWDYLPPALAPDSPADCDGCFSGTAIESHGKHILCYTGVSEGIQNQCLASGDGFKYEKFKFNPAVTAKDIPFEYQRQDFRDPKIFERDGKLYMLCVLKKMDGCGGMVLFENDSTEDLSTWKFLNVIAESDDGKTGMWECPDYFKLSEKDALIFSPQEMKADFDRGFHDGNNSVYMCGKLDFSTARFFPEMLGNSMTYSQIDFGIDFYAPETTELPDGRRIMIAWMSSWESPSTPKDYPWSGMMTFPRELRFHENSLIQNPVKEIQLYRKEHRRFEISIQSDGENELQEIHVPDARHFDSELEFKIDSVDTLIFRIGNESHFSELNYCTKSMLLTFDRKNTLNSGGRINSRSVKIPPKQNGNISLRMLADTNSIEVFANDGLIAFTNVFFLPDDCEGIFILATSRNKKNDEKIIFDYNSIAT